MHELCYILQAFKECTEINIEYCRPYKGRKGSNEMSGTDITEIIIIGIIATAFAIGTFLCWIAGSYLRKIYYVCATAWDIGKNLELESHLDLIKMAD